MTLLEVRKETGHMPCVVVAAALLLGYVGEGIAAVAS